MFRVRVQESEGCKDKSKAEEGKDSANCVEAETSCGDESREATVEVETVPSGDSCRSQSALNIKASLTEVGPNAKDQEGEDKSKAKAGKDIVDVAEPGTLPGSSCCCRALLASRFLHYYT